ncbi:class I SAM-dependent DNA methyltransferase [Oculatella sp. LEGE 06141]|uniref:DNA methyltransferase n=1 Tax=Oculatella sp. LEGE 06141 TaxID=1828648 RepID=UPI001882854A|nr:DNA methyltransferase [Oculatella sp. LEGE 06141]MBE9178160.1 class I SAM-dependent DNA methyltransferase [Oculatella sp. LEGE 06141]
MPSTPETLSKFIQFCQQHLKGDEKGEAQVFLDRFFRAFGHEGAIEAGATYEERVKKGSKAGRTGFADLVWKPRVLIEMKKRGEDLNKHYSQAFEYWTRLVPDRPRYVLLCNFDEFWIFDFDIQLDTPVDMIPLVQLPERISAFAFMEFENRTPVFNNNQIEVTERAARRMGALLVELKKRGIDGLVAQRFILQCVLAMFAEDRRLLPNSLFISCVQDCLNGQSSYDMLGGLFREMNTPGITPAGRYQGVDYFNGGLFSLIHPLQLSKEELKFLEVCALEDWSKVRPAIFGNLFESAIDEQERHAHGIHFTSEADIMKIVRPTISRYWEERIEAASTIAELTALQLELQTYKVLDPACGSGNFLYIAYQELKRIEQVLLDKMAERRRSPREQMQMGFVTPQQFYGMDTNPFAVELARVTMMIGRKVAIDRLGLFEPALPLDTLDQNIECKDALFNEWVKADAIIGNPPFLGGKHMRIAIGDEYIDRVFNRFPDVRDSVDFCAYWFRLAHDLIQETNGRAGLVGTNSISQGKSRTASLGYITQNNGYIHEAVSTQVWSGEANVHVSIANWSREEPKRYFLDNVEVPHIISSLKAITDVTQAVRLKANLNWCFQGVIPVGEGFIVTEEQVNSWIETDPKNKNVLKLFSMGANLAKNPNGLPERWIVDFNDMSIEEASEYKLPFNHVRTTVKPVRDRNRREVTKLNWWKYGEKRPALRRALAPLSYCFAVPEVSKWALFIPFPNNWLAGNNAHPVVSDDFYILGILTSNVHRLWVKAQSSTLEDRTRYTHNTCFETFPFPQNPDSNIVEQIRSSALELHQYRSEQMEKKQWGITKLYNEYFAEPTSQLYKLHAKLDRLVMQAYGFSDSDDILEKLLALNLELAEKEKRGESVIGPWAPQTE